MKKIELIFVLVVGSNPYKSVFVKTSRWTNSNGVVVNSNLLLSHLLHVSIVDGVVVTFR